MSPVRLKTRTTKDGEKRYLVYYRRGGRGFKDEYAGSFRTRKEQLTRRDFVAGELAAGRDPKVTLAALAAPPKPPTGLLERWDTFMASRIDVSPKAQAQYRNSRDRWVPILGAHTDPATLATRDIIDGIAELAEDLAPSTISQYTSNLGMVLDFCDVEPNPVRSAKVKMPRANASAIEIPNTKAWFAIRTHVKRRSRLALRVIECCGLRVNECAGLEWGDIDFGERQIRIRRENTKTASGRRWIPVPQVLLNEIAGLVPLEDRVMSSRVFGVNDDRIRYDLDKACGAAAMGDYSPHEFRHRRISLWIRHGFDPVRLARLAGHSRSSMSLDKYGHDVLDPREDEWRDFWLAISEGRRPDGEASVGHQDDGVSLDPASMLGAAGFPSSQVVVSLDPSDAALRDRGGSDAS